MVAVAERSSTALTPEAPHDWFEADPMLIHCPQLDLAIGMRFGECLHRRRKRFFETLPARQGRP